MGLGGAGPEEELSWEQEEHSESRRRKENKRGKRTLGREKCSATINELSPIPVFQIPLKTPKIKWSIVILELDAF